MRVYLSKNFFIILIKMDKINSKKINSKKINSRDIEREEKVFNILNDILNGKEEKYKITKRKN